MHNFMHDGPDQMGQEFMHGGHHYGGHMPFPFFAPLLQLLWLALLIFLIYLFIRWLTRRGGIRWNAFMASTHRDGPPSGPGGDVPPPFAEQPSALEILNRRYANGEIDATTFENMRERIVSSQPKN